MRGQRVIVRAYGNNALIRRVWDVTSTTVYVVEENEYQKLCNGFKAYDPVGFPIEDVFKYSNEIESRQKLDWFKLINWEVESY